MKFLHLLILGPLSILSLKSTAQVEDLMRDKNITWIGEFTTDYVVEGSKALDTLGYTNSSKILKYLNPKTDYFLDDDTPFESKIRYSNHRKSIFNDSSLKRKWTYYDIDTIVRINPMTGEKEYVIPYVQFNPPNPPHFYRAHQILFYNSKTMNFGLRVLAIGLIGDKHNESGEIDGLCEQGWVKPHNIGRKKLNLNDPNIIIARRLFSRSNAVVLDKVKILKNTIGDIQQIFIDDLSRKNSIDLYGDEGDYTKKHSKTVKDSLLKNIRQAIAESKLPKDSSKLVPQKDSAKIKYIYYNRSNDDVDPNVNPDVFPDFTRMGLNDTVKIKSKIEIDTFKTKVAVIDSFPDFTPPSWADSLVLHGSKAIYKLRIIQDWYWDEKLKNICVRLFAVAPMKKIYNDADEFIFDLPLFYRLND
jgi:hypothetical protein